MGRLGADTIVQMIRKASCGGRPDVRRSVALDPRAPVTYRGARTRIVIERLAPLPKALVAPVAGLVREMVLVRFELFERNPAVDRASLTTKVVSETGPNTLGGPKRCTYLERELEVAVALPGHAVLLLAAVFSEADIARSRAGQRRRQVGLFGQGALLFGFGRFARQVQRDVLLMARVLPVLGSIHGQWE